MSTRLRRMGGNALCALSYWLSSYCFGFVYYLQIRFWCLVRWSHMIAGTYIYVNSAAKSRKTRNIFIIFTMS